MCDHFLNIAIYACVIGQVIDFEMESKCYSALGKRSCGYNQPVKFERFLQEETTFSKWKTQFSIKQSNQFENLHKKTSMLAV